MYWAISFERNTLPEKVDSSVGRVLHTLLHRKKYFHLFGVDGVVKPVVFK